MRSGWSETLRFKRGTDERLRPYLWLTFRALGDGKEVPIVGIVDSGADKSVLPLEYAQLLGYRKRDLKKEPIDQVEGEATGYHATIECEAYVRGLADRAFKVRPMFVETFDALWGRGDLMSAYTVTISARRSYLKLSLP